MPQGVLRANQDGELGRGVAIELTADEKVAIAQGLGTQVGQLFSAALSGETTVDQALASAQQITTREMTKAGYIK